MDVIKSITQEYMKDDIPAFGVGDIVKVHIKIKEGNRERIQVFEGFVLKKQNGGVSETFTVRKISSGVGVEKVKSEEPNSTICVREQVKLRRSKPRNNWYGNPSGFPFLL